MKLWKPKSPGNFWVTPGQLQDAFTFLTFVQDDADGRAVEGEFLQPLGCWDRGFESL